MANDLARKTVEVMVEFAGSASIIAACMGNDEKIDDMESSTLKVLLPILLSKMPPVRLIHKRPLD